MHLKKRLSVLAIAAVAASFAAVPANAAAAETATCAFTGLAGKITPGVRAILNGTGGGGTYEFGGNANCVYSNGGAPISSPATITSFGSFTNDICSTGTAFGDTNNFDLALKKGTRIDFQAAGIPDINQVDYQIRFVGGQGLLRGGNQTTKPNGATGTVNNDSSYSAGGYVDIRPSVGDCVTTDVTEFAVTGTFTAARQ
jgi:hypothetical protein